MLQRKRARRAKAKPPKTPAPPPPPASPAPPADPDAPPRDREGRPIRAGALIVEHAGGIPHAAFGRVIAAAGAVLLFRTFPGNELFGDDVDSGSVMYADAGDCSVIEDPLPVGAMPPVAAAAAAMCMRLAAIEGELASAAALTSRRKELDDALTSVRDARFEMIGLLSQHMDDDGAGGALAAAFAAEKTQQGQHFAAAETPAPLPGEGAQHA